MPTRRDPTNLLNPPGIKRCSKCRKLKPARCFYRSDRWKSGLYPQCKLCHNHKVQRRRQDLLAADPEHYAHRHRQRFHGLSRQDYERMVGSQKGRCAVCFRKRKLVVDHNHDTGRVRGLLCSPCNSALGMVNDDPVWVRNLSAYLESTDPTALVRLGEVGAGLLEAFSVMDDVFTEDDAFSEPKIKMGMGRMYRAWVDCRRALDPEFNTEQLERPQRWLPKTVREARRSTSRPAPNSKNSSTVQRQTSAKKQTTRATREKQ